MTVRQNVGTTHFRWMLTDKPYANNIEAGRRFWSTVNVAVSNNGYAMSQELTPSEARELAAALFDLANMAESDAQERGSSSHGD